MTPAHTIIVPDFLGTLLQLDDQVNINDFQNCPLVHYAAQHSVGHAQFDDVSLSVQDGTKLLFGPSKPNFAAWIWIYGPSAPWRSRSKSLSQPGGTPLHYTGALYELRDVVEFLATELSQDVNSGDTSHQN